MAEYKREKIDGLILELRAKLDFCLGLLEYLSDNVDDFQALAIDYMNKEMIIRLKSLDVDDGLIDVGDNPKSRTNGKEDKQ